jgi:hypothetical protein
MSQSLNPLKGFIEIEVRDREGRVIQRGRHEMKSFTNNFLKILEGFFNSYGNYSPGYQAHPATKTTVVASDGSSKDAWIEAYSFDNYYGPAGGGVAMATRAGDNVDSYGIVVGSGTAPFNLNNYALATKIAHGTGAGQLDYDAMSLDDLGLDTSVSPPVYRVRLLRGFKNLTTSPITIAEVGVIARNYWKRSGGVLNDVTFLIARDVLPTNYTVPAGGSATVAVVIEVVMG